MVIFDCAQLKTYVSLFTSLIRECTKINISASKSREFAALAAGKNSYNHLIHDVKSQPVDISNLDILSLKQALYLKHKYTLDDADTTTLSEFFLTYHLDLVPTINVPGNYLFSHFEMPSIENAIDNAKLFICEEEPVDISGYEKIILSFDFYPDYHIDNTMCDFIGHAVKLQNVEFKSDDDYELWDTNNKKMVDTARTFFLEGMLPDLQHDALSESAGIEFCTYQINALSNTYPHAHAVFAEKFDDTAWLGLWRVIPVHMDMWEGMQPSVMAVSQTCYAAVFSKGEWNFIGSSNAESVVLGGPHQCCSEETFFYYMDAISQMHCDLAKETIFYAKQHFGSFDGFFDECINTDDRTITLLNNCKNKFDSSEINFLMASLLTTDFTYAGFTPDIDEDELTEYNLPIIYNTSVVFKHVVDPKIKERVVTTIPFYSDAELSEEVREPMSENDIKTKPKDLEFAELLIERFKPFNLVVHTFDPYKYPST